MAKHRMDDKATNAEALKLINSGQMDAATTLLKSTSRANRDAIMGRISKAQKIARGK